MSKKIFIFPFIVFLLIVFIFIISLVLNRNPSELPSVLINKEVPKFTANQLNNKKKFNSEKEFKDQVTIVNFFATWCGPCLEEHVYIMRLAKHEGIKIIGINYKDEEEKTNIWLKKLGNPYSQILLDKNGRIGIDWGVYGIPETYIINRNGIIKFRLVGPVTKKNYSFFIKKIKETKIK